jgi:hypothetical protein
MLTMLTHVGSHRASEGLTHGRGYQHRRSLLSINATLTNLRNQRVGSNGLDTLLERNLNDMRASLRGRDELAVRVQQALLLTTKKQAAQVVRVVVQCLEATGFPRLW